MARPTYSGKWLSLTLKTIMAWVSSRRSRNSSQKKSSPTSRKIVSTTLCISTLLILSFQYRLTPCTSIRGMTFDQAVDNLITISAGSQTISRPVCGRLCIIRFMHSWNAKNQPFWTCNVSWPDWRKFAKWNYLHNPKPPHRCISSKLFSPRSRGTLVCRSIAGLPTG